jgi:hypothetical protein
LLRHRLRGLVSSRSHVQASHHSGASLSVQRFSLARDSGPLAVDVDALTGSHRLPRTAASTSRLRSARSSVLGETGVIHPACRSPPWFHSSGLRPHTVDLLYSGPPLASFLPGPSLARSSCSMLLSVLSVQSR